MTNGNLPLSPRSYTPNIILDPINIGFSIILICKTVLFILLILIRHRLIKSGDKILFLLSFNMYISIFLFALFVLDMFILMMKSPMNPNLSHDTFQCRLKAYLSNVALIYSLYSNTFQALYRFFRIIYYTRHFFHRNIYLYIVGILIQVFLSVLQPLPLILIGEYQYEDYHCQVQFTNWRGMIIAALLVWLLPISFIITIYAYTIYYILCNSALFTLRQETRFKRDLIVIRRILWLIIFIVIFGMPACSAAIVYYLFGYVEWWENHLIWLTFVLSFMGVSIVQTYFSPHLRILWSISLHRASPAISST
jgi:hypothetical protein